MMREGSKKPLQGTVSYSLGGALEALEARIHPCTGVHGCHGNPIVLKLSLSKLWSELPEVGGWKTRAEGFRKTEADHMKDGVCLVTLT